MSASLEIKACLFYALNMQRQGWFIPLYIIQRQMLVLSLSGFLYCFGRCAYLLFCVKNTKQTAGKRSVLYCVFYENEARSKQAHFNYVAVTIYRCYSIIIPKIAVKSSMFRIFCRNSKAKRQIAHKLQVKFVD